MPKRGGEGSNQTPIELFFTIRTENLWEGGSSLNSQFPNVKHFVSFSLGVVVGSIYDKSENLLVPNFHQMRRG